MSLPNYTGWTNALDPNSPAGTDPKSQGDDHIRGLALTIQQTLGSLDGTFADKGTAAYAKAAPGGSAFGFRNKIIGGDFTTNPWQRGTSFTAPAAGAYCADRFNVGHSIDGVINVLKTADAPTAAQAGVFTQHCLHVDVTTADPTIAAGQTCNVGHTIEGLNSASFGFGQAGTRYVTLSFWHKHTKTGTYCASLRNSANDRAYVAEYTQDVTDTWEQAVLTIPVDTSGTWLYDTGVGLRVAFAVAMGSTYQTTANTWAAGNFLATANQVNALDSTANNFKIALVQLEAGDKASPFESRDVGDVLRQCQRFFQVLVGNGFSGQVTSTSGVLLQKSLPVNLRDTGTFTLTKTAYAAASFEFLSNGLWVNNAVAISGGAQALGNGLTFTLSGFSGLTVGATASFNLATQIGTVSAEL